MLCNVAISNSQMRSAIECSTFCMMSLIIIPLAPEVNKKKFPLYANATIVALITHMFQRMYLVHEISYEYIVLTTLLCG